MFIDYLVFEEKNSGNDRKIIPFLIALSSADIPANPERADAAPSSCVALLT
jgi:hypothetical protein